MAFKQQNFENLLNKPIEIKIKPLGLDADKLMTEEVMKVLRHEYASKHLEVMGIEPNAANVMTLLKMKPLSKCKIETGGSSGEGHSDAVDLIRIYPNPGSSNEDKNKNKRKEQLRAIDCDRLFNSKLQRFEELYHKAKFNSSIDHDGKDQGEDFSNGHEAKMTTTSMSDRHLPNIYKGDQKFDDKLLDYSFENIKKRYLGRADQTENTAQKLRKAQSTNSFTAQGGSSIYEFDFSKLRLEKPAIKELQTPFEVTSADLKMANSQFLKEFPFMRIPIVNIDKLIAEKKIGEYLDIYGEDKKRFSEKKYIEIQMHHSHSKNKFELIDIKLLRQNIDMEEVNKIQGLLLHLSNSIVFGKLSLVQIEPIKTKQMLVLMLSYFTKLENETRENIKKRGNSVSGPELRLWNRLICPVLIINFKMIAEYFYLKKCPIFFKTEKIRTDAFKLIFSLIEEIFDPTGLNSQVLFWHETVGSSHPRLLALARRKECQL